MGGDRLLCLTFQITGRCTFLLPGWQWIMTIYCILIRHNPSVFLQCCGDRNSTLNGLKIWSIPVPLYSFSVHLTSLPFQVIKAPYHFRSLCSMSLSEFCCPLSSIQLLLLFQFLSKSILTLFSGNIFLAKFSMQTQSPDYIFIEYPAVFFRALNTIHHNTLMIILDNTIEVNIPQHAAKAVSILFHYYILAP